MTSYMRKKIRYVTQHAFSSCNALHAPINLIENECEMGALVLYHNAEISSNNRDLCILKHFLCTVWR